MVDHLVLINGLPGSGKTTLAAALAPVMAAPVIAKDALKEAMADSDPAVPAGRLGRMAAEQMWVLAAATPGTVLMESWWFAPRDRSAVTADLHRCGPRAVVEVWCDVPAEVAYRRYVTRQRHPVHDDLRRAAESWPVWAARAEPLAVAPTVSVRTDGPVDHAAVAREIAAALAT